MGKHTHKQLSSRFRREKVPLQRCVQQLPDVRFCCCWPWACQPPFLLPSRGRAQQVGQEPMGTRDSLVLTSQEHCKVPSTASSILMGMVIRDSEDTTTSTVTITSDLTVATQEALEEAIQEDITAVETSATEATTVFTVKPSEWLHQQGR